MKEILQKMIDSKESEVLEFKVSFGKAVIETICAFANHKGGTILIGVDDSGKIIGSKYGQETLQSWTNQIKQNTQPSIIPHIEKVTFKNKDIVIIRVHEFPVKPVACRDRYFKRVSNSNHRLNLTEITNLHLQSLQLSWDSYVDNNSTIHDLDEDKINLFLKRINESGRLQVEKAWQTVLKKLGYLNQDRPTHAAMLLLGREIPPYGITFQKREINSLFYLIMQQSRMPLYSS